MHRSHPSLLCRTILSLLLAPCGRAFGQAARPAGSLGSPDRQLSAEQPVGWRGDGTGRYLGATPPTQWERRDAGNGVYQTTNIRWVTKLPSYSPANPTVAGDKVLVLSEPSDLLCLDKNSGRILWIASNTPFEALTEADRVALPDSEKLAGMVKQLNDINAEFMAASNAQVTDVGPSEEARKAMEGILKRKKDLTKQLKQAMVAADKKRFDVDWQQGVFGESGATPFCDGKSVYVWFGAGVTARYSMDGKREWISFDNFGWCEHGIYASPMVVDGKLITWMDGMTAFDAKTGQRLWHTPMRTGAVWGSVVLCTVAGEKLVTTTDGTFVRVSDGKEVWEKNFFGSHHVPTPIIEDGVVYTYMQTNSYKGFGAIALPDRIEGGKLKVLYTREKEFAWDDSELPEKNFARGVIASPLYHDGLIYLLSEGGGLRVVEAKTGQTVYKKVLDMKPLTAYWNFGGCSASPTLAGKYIYVLDNKGTTIVIEPGREFRQVARNVIANAPFGKPKEQDVTITTPVFDGKLMFIRGPEYLYCIGEK